MRSALAVIAVIALAGCERLFDVVTGPNDSAGGGQGSDAPAVLDGPPGCITVGMNGASNGLIAAGFYQRCVLDNGEHLVLSGPFSTSGAQCDLQTIDSSVCAMVASEIEIQGTLSVTGPLPLVLVATSAITVSGTLSVSSDASMLEPAANWTSCDTLALAGHDDGEGGAGGTLDANYLGGYGGASQSPGPAAIAPTAPFASLHGGCQGGTGSLGPVPPTNAGGAVYLMAPIITVTGAIAADGAPGVGGSAGSRGGYGGGSGGMIALDAPVIAFGGGMVHAVGGGGGGGGGSKTGDGGAGTGGAGGVAGDATAGYGGDGYMMPQQAFPGGPGTQSQTGLPGAGGGGGGGAGAILLFTAEAIMGGSFDPPPYQ